MRKALAAAMLLLAGCGGSAAPQALAPADSALLHRDVSAIRAAAASRVPAVAHAQLAAFRTHVQALASAGRLAAADARLLLRLADHGDGRISAEVHPAAPQPAAPPAVSAAPQTPAAAPASPGDNGHGKGKGKGNGKGGGDGGD
ncbi:MAG: hypothetical protein NVSMB51_16750 [Solirubrobacteraceae bacterium]